MESGTGKKVLIVLVISVFVISALALSVNAQEPTGLATATAQLRVAYTDIGNLSVTVQNNLGNAIESATVEIRNSTNNNIKSGTTNSSGQVVLSLGIGNYTAEASHSSYDNASEDAEVKVNKTTSIIIIFGEVVAPTAPEKEAAAGAAAGGPPAPKKYELTIVKYEKTIEIAIGETKSFAVTVQNTGEKTLANIRLSIIGISEINGVEIFEITPKIVDTVESGSNKTFLVTVKIPHSAIEGTYPLLLKAESDETTTKKAIELVITPPKKPAAKISLLHEEIRFLRTVMNEITTETLSLESKGAYVTHVLKLLLLVNEKLDKATEFDKIGDPENAETQIEIARDILTKAVELLAEVEMPRKKSAVEISVFTVVVVFVLAITAHLYLKEAKRMKIKKVRKLLIKTKGFKKGKIIKILKEFRELQRKKARKLLQKFGRKR